MKSKHLPLASAGWILAVCTLAYASASAPWVCPQPQESATGQADSRSGQAAAAQEEREDSSGTSTAAYTKAQALIAESQAALERSDYDAARLHAAEAVDALLSIPETDRGGTWAAWLNYAAHASWNTRDAVTARQAWQGALDAFQRTLPEDHADILAAEFHLALTLQQLGDLQGARALQESVLQGFERTLPADHSNVLAARVNLGLTLQQLGDLHGARVLQEATLRASERTLPRDHPTLVGGQLNLAVTLYNLGDVRGAQALFGAALEARERTLPEGHPDLLRARAGLATVMHKLGDLKAARALEEATLVALERILPEDSLQLVLARQSLAGTLRAMGDLEGAHTLYLSVLASRERTLTEDHPELSRARANLAVSRKELGDLAGARVLDDAVLDSLVNALPADHPDLLEARWNAALTLAGLAADAGSRGEGLDAAEEWRGAVAVVSEAAAGARDAARNVLWTAALREAEERVASGTQRALGQTLSFAAGLGHFAPTAGLYLKAFEISEASRAVGLAGAALSRSGMDPEVRQRLRAEILAAGEELAGLARQGATREEYHRVRGRREVAERELLALARSHAREGIGALDVEAGRLVSDLGPKRALVGFRRYQHTWLEDVNASAPLKGESRWNSRTSDHLGAFVLTSVEDKPQLAFVDLGVISAIDDAVQAWRSAVGLVYAGPDPPGGGGAPEGRGLGLAPRPSASGRAEAVRLRELVWDPLVGALGDAEEVVVALDDVLHLVPLDALPIDEGEQLVGDRWKVQTRVALWELLDAPRPPSSQLGLVSLGGASFDAQPLTLGAEKSIAVDSEPSAETKAPELAIALLRGGAWEQGFAPLTYTRTEAQGLAAVFAEAFHSEAPALVLDGPHASREALVEAAPKARYLHVATHGWFAPESIRSWADATAEGENTIQRLSGRDTVRGMSPMLLCGLALAGANLSPNAVGRVPGLVTAEELSGLDLTGCELAVLSACDTNVGERRAGQGVASLQKALHMAGARSVITSLWKVPDEATSELMLDFYRRLWVEKKPKHQALWEAKLRLRNAVDERGEPLYTTRDWAAWVLTGDPN